MANDEITQDQLNKWKAFKNNEPGIEAPAWYADPVNYVQTGGALARAAGRGVINAAVGSLGGGLGIQEGIGATVPGMASKIISKLPSGEIKDAASIASWVSQKLGIGGRGFVNKALDTAKRRPISTFVATANAPGSGRSTDLMDLGATKPPVVETPPSAPIASPPAKPTMELTDEATLRASVGAPADGHRANRNEILYTAINNLDDKQFVQFMKDNPNIPGLGFAKSADGKVIRFAENPDKKPKEPMSPLEADAVSKIITANAHMQAGIGTREHAAQAGRIADMEKARMNDEKLLLDFQNNKLVFHSPVIAYGPDNKSIRDPELGLLKMLDTNKKIHPEYRDAAVQIWNERESHVRDVMNQMFKDKKGPQYDPTKINDLKSEVGKTRKSLLKAWEDRRLESLRKKVQVY